MPFHSFKNVEKVHVYLKTQSSGLYGDNRNLDHVAFFCNFNYVDFDFSDSIDISTLISESSTPFSNALLLCYNFPSCSKLTIKTLQQGVKYVQS